MSKGIGKRRKKRYQELKAMATTMPNRFMAVWVLKLSSWSGEVKKWVELLNLKQANTVIDYALRELDSCGPTAVQMAGKQTKRTLEDTRNSVLESLVHKKETELRDTWNRNIRWMCKQAFIRAESLDQPRAFGIVSEAIDELRAFGPDVWHRLVVGIAKTKDNDCALTGDNEWEQVTTYTKTQLEDACAKAVAKAYDYRMYSV
jgi:hypothetical protein